MHFFNPATLMPLVEIVRAERTEEAPYETAYALGKRLGFGDAHPKVEAKWLAAAEAALDQNPITFATLAMQDMLGPTIAPATLQPKGYLVLAPGA